MSEGSRQLSFYHDNPVTVCRANLLRLRRNFFNHFWALLPLKRAFLHFKIKLWNIQPHDLGMKLISYCLFYEIMFRDNQKIMVVDDEPDILTVLEIFLKKWGYKVDVFSSPREALEHFEKNSAFSVVLTDIRMPRMSGLELAGKMLKIKPDVQIILMTAFDILPAELQAGLPAVTTKDLIEKPFYLPQICQEIRKRLPQ